MTQNKQILCCENTKALIQRNYIDGPMLYLQKTKINVGFPPNISSFKYCMTCGKETSKHIEDLIEGNEYCYTIRNGRLNGLFDSNDMWKHAIFNLVSKEQYLAYTGPSSDHPDPVQAYYCPYCGTEL